MAKKITIAVSTLFFILLPLFNSAIGQVLKEEDKREILNKVHSLQIPFMENKGQIKAEGVKYYAKTFGGTVFITKDGEIVYSLPLSINPQSAIQNPKSEGWVIKESLVGTSILEVKGEEEAATKVSYFKGKDPSEWRRGISTYNLLSLGEIYKGIELKLKAHGNNVEKLFYVKPRANPESIKVKIEGAKGLKVNEKGELELETGPGVIKFTRPVAYQEIDGKRVEVAVAYNTIPQSEISNPQFEYGFKVGNYDREKDLLIDPLLASTFLGGASDERAYSIAIDSGGNVYVAGGTISSDFPVTPGAYDTSFNGGTDAFVSKFDGNLTNLLASTFLGGGDYDYYEGAYSIAIDSGGNVYVAGVTSSGDFPVTPGAYDTSYNEGYEDAFVSKFDENLTNLLASTFLGGASYEYAYSIAIGSDGNVYVAGETCSGDFPVTPGAYDTSLYNWGGSDAFVSKFDENLTNLLASTFLGGVYYNEGANSIAIGSGGNVYVAGHTTSGDFPVTPGAYDTSHNGNSEAFVSKFDENLTNLLASTFLGGANYEGAYSIAIDSGGNVYVAGETNSKDFPVTSSAYDTSLRYYDDAFVSKFDENLTNLLASTFLGGANNDLEGAYSIAIGSDGNVYVAGRTCSEDFPVTANAYDTSFNGYYYDTFVSKFDGNLTNLLASTFLGGASSEYANSIAIGSGGNVYVAGHTTSGDFPVTSSAYDTSFNGLIDAFVSKFDGDLSAGATYSISGKVTFSGSGLSGVTMTLSGDSSGTTTTNEKGNYRFTGLADGHYNVKPTKAGYTFSPTSREVTISGANVRSVNFRVRMQGGY